MHKNWYPFLIIVALGLILFLLKWSGITTPSGDKTSTTKDAVDRESGFDRRTGLLKYSKHAQCRMDCRDISKAEVEQVMEQGDINYGKSDLDNARCPRYTVEARTVDSQLVRIVYAQCNNWTTVVTVIDLETEHTCHCPGDDKKYINN